jgi:hypothetical protein
MKENYTMSLTYGLREQQAWNRIDSLMKSGNLPTNRNEVVRRGIHATSYLGQVNEKPLLHMLYDILSISIKTLKPEYIDQAKNLSLAIYATMIAKYGLGRAETFDTIPMNLVYLEKNKEITEKSKTNETEQEIKKGLGELATSVDAIFIKRSLFQPEVKSKT